MTMAPTGASTLPGAASATCAISWGAIIARGGAATRARRALLAALRHFGTTAGRKLERAAAEIIVFRSVCRNGERRLEGAGVSKEADEVEGGCMEVLHR
jgi:hypothetical protein